jgi:Amt family ammonium transporter
MFRNVRWSTDRAGWGAGLKTGLAALVAGALLSTGLMAAQAQTPEAPPPATTEVAPATPEVAPATPEVAPEATPAPEASAEAAPEEAAAPTGLLASQQAYVGESGATAWILTSTALVLLMTIPGLALFYGGMVRKKNFITIVTQSFAITCLISVLWVVVIYSTAFGTNTNEAMNAWFGGFDLAMLNHVTAETSHSATADLPEYLWIVYQMTFGIITVALITGAYADRMKFLPMLIFSGLWGVLVYGPVCHWVWGGGWLGGLGALDFAGGTVVHINAGVAGLVAALVLGKRKGYGSENMAPNNVVMTMIGASLLWVGWFGFNAGSAWTADAGSSLAMLNTQIATALAGLVWMIIEMLHRKKATMLGLASGAVAGLVAITPAAGLVDTTAALVIGAAGGLGGYFGAVFLKKMLKYDDSLDVFGVHGVCGIIGAILTGVFAQGDGVSMPQQVMIQLTAVGAVIAYSAVVSLAILLLLKFTIGLRVKPEDEDEGLDYALHGEVIH